MAGIDYAQAGVNREAADQFVNRIALLSKATLNRRVKASIGGYASLYELDSKRWLAASTDGVGTKLKLAFQLNEHRTIGIDLVAMSVNDLLCVGAEPLFFLDYFATGKLDQAVGVQVLEGIVEGCKQARCALVGGETAEMPDLYQKGEYDLAGFAVGFVQPRNVLPAQKIIPGDLLIGIGSSGCHSNGYSLLRKLLAADYSDARARELLTPTRIYARALAPLIEKKWIKGLAHITGSGFLNVPRISEKVSYEIRLPSSEKLPPIFDWVKDKSGLSPIELAQTFNMGIGMVCVVSRARAADVIKSLTKSKEKVFALGQVVKKSAKKPSQVHIFEEGKSSLTLDY